MARILPLITLVVVLVIGITTFHFVHKRHAQIKLSNGSIMLYASSGVQYKNPGMGDFAVATATTQLLSGAEITTGPGQAVILFPNNDNIALGNATVIDIMYENQKVTVTQKTGATYERKLSVSSENFSVITPDAQISADGTMFAVLTGSTTEAAVTQHQITITAKNGENKTVTEGQYGIVQKTIDVLNYIPDQAMSLWVHENQIRDTDILNLEGSQGKDLHQALGDLFANTLSSSTAQIVVAGSERTPTSGSSTIPHKTGSSSGSVATSTSSASTSTPSTSTSTATTTPQVDKEAYLAKFRPLFTQYFYLDDKNTPCRQSVTPEERVGIVTNFAKENGYPFTSSTLLDFAKQINAFCTGRGKDHSEEIKAALQARFKAEYPYQG